MESTDRDRKVIEPVAARVPEIGRWLWALQDGRRSTLETLDGLNPALVDWRPPGNESSLGTVLSHMADVEADWLYVEVLEQDWPPEVWALFPHPFRDEHGELTQVSGYTLEQHLDQLATVRALLLDVFQVMDLDDFRRARSLPQYDVTPEWVLHHLIQHEAEHRGQIGSLRDRARRAGTGG